MFLIIFVKPVPVGHGCDLIRIVFSASKDERLCIKRVKERDLTN